MKKLSTIFLLAVTIISGGLMVKINSLQATTQAISDKNVFLEEVRKPDGSGYIFGEEDGISISVDNI
ncbi:MAG: hypothetical protein RR645_06375, partial [Clostridium sp.]